MPPIMQSQKTRCSLATSTLVIASSKALQKMSYIQYLVQFQINEVQPLIDSGNKINIIILAYATKLGFTA